MIRAILSAHLRDGDIDSQAIFLNKSALGIHSEREAASCVMPAMLKTHMMGSLGKLKKIRSQAEIASAEANWQAILRQAQITDPLLAASELAASDLALDSAFIISPEVVLVWLERSRGLYLYRAGELYRLQPIARGEKSAIDFSQALDLYAFHPQSKDLIFAIEPEFIAAFDAKYLERLLGEEASFQSATEKLCKQIQTYRSNFDISWLAIEIKQIEENAIALSNRDDAYFYQPKEARKRQRYLSELRSSKASRVIYGQKLILPKEGRELIEQRFNPEPKQSRGERLRPRPTLERRKFSERLLEREERSRQAELYRNRERVMERYAKPQNRREAIEKKIQEFSFEAFMAKVKDKTVRFIRKTHKNPRILYTILAIFMLLMLLFILFKFWSNTEVEEEDNAEEVVITSTVEETVEGIVAEAPEVTNLEISRVLKSNNLQIRQRPESSSALIATAHRGDRILQLSEVLDSWVYIRLVDSGIEGYVYADYLID